MNLCLTSRSVKLLGTYFEKNLSSIVTNDKSYEEIQRELFDKALTDFQTPETKERTKELLIQHLTILPQVLSKYLGDTPSVNNGELFTRVNSLRGTVYSASQTGSLDDLQQIVDDITSTLGIGSMVISEGGPLRFNAVSFVLAKEIGQEKIHNNVDGYSKNVTDPTKIQEAAVRKEIITSDNSAGYQFKLMTVGEAMMLDSISYPYDQSNSEKPMMVIVDSTGKPVSFDENGAVSPTGNIIGVPIRTTKAEYEYAMNSQIEIYSAKGEMTVEGATKFVHASVDAHIQMLDTAIEKIGRGEEVLFDMDMSNSSLGFTELNNSRQTPLRAITNLEQSEVIVNRKGKASFPALNIPNSNTPARIYNSPIDSLSEDKMNNLIELFTNPNLTMHGAPMSLAQRQKLITTLLQFKAPSKAVNDFAFTITPTNDGTMISSIVVGDRRMKVDGKDFKEKFMAQISGFKGFPYAGALPNNYEVVEGIENVTFQNQVYTDNGVTLIARKPEISFGFYPGITMASPVEIVQNIENNAVTTIKQDRAEYIKDNGYTVVVPNAEGKVQGYSSYIAYTSIESKTSMKPSDDFSFFSSVAELNDRTTATKAEQTEADKWWESNPLNSVVKVAISDQVHEKGPKYIADFIGDTISLRAGSDKTEIYHEAFHAYIQGILTEAQRTEMFNEVRAMKGEFSVVVNAKKQTVKFKDATDLQVEEYLAVEFKAFAKGNKKFQKNTMIGRFFQMLMDALNKLFGNHTANEVKYLNKFGPEVKAVFNDLYNGNFEASKFVAPSSSLERYSSFEGVPDMELDHQEMNLTMTSMKALMGRFIMTALNTTSTPEKTVEITNLLTQMSSVSPNAENYDSEIRAVYDKINAFEREAGPRNGMGVLRLTSNPKTLASSLIYIQNVLKQKRDIYASKDGVLDKENVVMLDKVLSNFGDPKASIKSFRKDNKTIIGIFLNNHAPFSFDKKFDEDIAWNDENIEDNFRLVFDRTGAEQTIDEGVNETTEQILGGIMRFDRQGRGNMKLNRIGLPELLPFKVAIAKVVKAVGNRVDLDDIYTALHNASTTDKEIRQVLNMLGYLGSDQTSGVEQAQWGALWQDIAKATNNLRYFSMEKIEDEDTEEVSYKSVSGRSQESLRVISSQWRDNFKFESERNDEFYAVDETKGNERYLDADDLGTFVLDEYTTSVFIPRESTDAFYHEKNDPRVKYRTDLTGGRLKKWQADPFSLLKIIGITLPETHETREILLNGSPELGIDGGVIEYIVQSLINRTLAKNDKDTKIFNLEDLFKKFTYKGREAGKEIDVVQPDVSGYYTQLQQIVQHLSDEHINFSGFNAKGDRQSEKTKHSSLTVAVSTLNNAQRYDELIDIPGMSGFNYETNPHVAGSKWFTQMFNLDKPKDSKYFGERNPDISIVTETLSGSQILYDGADKGVAPIDSDELTKFITDFHLTLDGRQEIMRSEAKSTSHVVHAPVRVGDGSVRKGVVVNNVEVQDIYTEQYDSSKSPNSLLLYDQFSGNLEAELIRITRIKEVKKMIANGETVKFDAKYLKRGEDFFMFDMLLPNTVKNKLKGLNINESFSINNILTFAEKKQIETALKEYFEIRADELMKEKGDQLVIGDNILEKYQLNEEESIEDVKNRLSKVFVINNFINNINYSSLFLGDPAVYDVEGEDFHKRIAGLISTGDLFRFDATWYDFINSPRFEARGFAKKHAADSGKEYTALPYDGHLNAGVMKESTHNSAYKKHYAEFAGVPESDYENIDEADASGWITLDSYRLLLKSSNEWSDDQEDLYQKMLKGQPLDALKIKATFPIKKYQYYGDVSNLDGNNYGLQMKAFHKYALAPIVPALVEGAPLEALNQKMMENGMDYVTMESGSKLSTISTIDNLETATADDIYTKERKISNIPFTVNRIHVRGLKSQVKVGEGYKGYITLPTQWRKMVMLGVMNGNNVPTDYKGKKNWDSLSDAQKQSESKNYKWLVKYENILDKIELHHRESLLRDIGMNEVVKDGTVSYEGDTKKLVNYIQSQLRNDDLLPEEVQFIMKPDGSMIDDLSLSLNSEKIEKVLTVMVDKKLRRLKVNGEPLVQQSGAMQEQVPFTEPSEEDIANYGTNGLRAYYLKDSEGNPVTKIGKDGIEEYVVSKMEVKISLQGDFKNLLYLTHPDESLIAQYKNGKLDFKASLDRLNDAISNKKWASENEKLLTLSGPRIPTQQENTLEAAVVKEFLPPFASNAIILPTEVVAKVGSDFDYDKLFLMFPNIININGQVKLQEYVEISETFEELYDDIESFNIVLDQEYKTRDGIRAERKAELSKIREIRNEVENINPEAYELIDSLKDERELLMTEATEAYKSTGRYVDATRDEQREVHARTSPRIQEITETLDSIYGLLDEAIENITATRDDVSSIEEITERFKSPLAEANSRISELKSQRAPFEEKLLQKGIGGLENQLLDAFQERITMGNNFPNLVKANSTSIFTEKDGTGTSLSDQADSFVKQTYNKKNRLLDKSGSKIARSTIFDYRYNLLKHQENSVGMDALGIAAIAATYYALFSRMGATLNATSDKKVQEYLNALEVLQKGTASEFDMNMAKSVVNKFGNYRLKFDHNKVKDELGDHIALGFLKNVDGLSISEVLGQLINGYVDVAKDPWIFKIQGNKQNTPAILFMSMAGMSAKDIVYFTSMPMVVEYNKIKAEMTGVFSDLNNEIGKNPIVTGSRLVQKARQEVFKRFNEKNGTNHKPSSYKVLANQIDGTLGWKELKPLGSTKRDSEKELKVLSHYFEVEDMGNHMTEFQGVTKFDTQKMSSISEAQERIENTKEFKSKETSVPNSWFADIDRTAVGVFNNDEFIVDMFSKYFGLRNNPIVVKASLNAKIPKGQLKTVFHNDFKNNFLTFLYQNSLYSNDVYSGYKLQESDDYQELLTIDEETKIVSYGQGYLNSRKSEVTQIIAGPNGFTDMSDFFPTDAHFLRFEIELEKIEDEVSEMTDAQIIEHFDIANSYSSSTGTATGVKYKMALYRSDNNVAMFDFRMGMGSILKKIMQRNPDLSDRFSLIHDMRFDYSIKDRKSNMWLSEIKDPEMARVYIENINNLKNHDVPEVAEFFHKFENMVIMQTGMNRRSKYDMAKIINQSMFNDVIENGIGVDRITRELKNVEISNLQGEDATSRHLEAFTEMFDHLSADENRYRLRVRGVNFMTEGLEAQTETAVLSSMTYNNTEIVSNFNDVPAGTTILEAEDLYDDENGGLNQDYIDQIKDSPIYIRDRKLRAPAGESQVELDAVLKAVFGINNNGKNPSLMGLSLGQNTDNISIATAEGIKLKHAHKDEAMANNSQVAIGQATIGNAQYRSSSQMYVDEINRSYPERLADTKTSFKAEDNVWVFGSGVFPNAYKGIDGGKESFESMINETFESYHKPMIDKAIKSNVSSFNVGIASGIDTIVGEYLEEKGYTPIVRYATTGKYMEYVKDVNYYTTDLYEVSKPKTKISDIGLSFIYNSKMAEQISEMNEEDIITSSPYEMVKADIIARVMSRFPDKASREYNIYKVMTENPGPLAVGNSNYSSLVERILMEFRREYNYTQDRKQLVQSVRGKQKKVDVNQLSEVDVKFSDENLLKIFELNKTSTVRNNKGASQIGLDVGQTGVFSLGGMRFTISNRGSLTIDEAGGITEMAKAEGLPTGPTRTNVYPIAHEGVTYYTQYKQTAQWMDAKNTMVMTMNVYDIAPVKQDNPTGFIERKDIDNLEDC